MNTQTAKSANLKKLITLGMLAAIAYAVMFFFRIPISTVEFLKFDPKDTIIVIAGFLYGPLPAFMVSLVVSLLEMVTVSATGPIGLVMNVLSSCAFCCTAAFVYKKRQTLAGAAMGLVLGVVMMTGAMLLWNYFITPMYMGISREALAGMLLPVFLPFNLLKGGINAALSMLLYKPLVLALRKAGFVASQRQGTAADPGKRHISAGAMLVAGIVLASCILFILVTKGII